MVVLGSVQIKKLLNYLNFTFVDIIDLKYADTVLNLVVKVPRDRS